MMRITQIIRNERISVVFSNGGKEHIYGGVAAYFTGRPSVWLCQGVPEVLDTLTRIVSLIPTSLILADSAHTQSILLRHFRKPIKMVYSGIELIRLGDLSLDSTRKDFKLRPTTSLVTMVGLFMEWKGQEFFIRAVPKVLHQFPEAKFLIVGDATRDCDKSYAERLRTLVRKLNLENKIIFTGFREDRLSIMASSDVIVHASTSPEPFGLVITEAMAAGKPIIATNIGAPKEIVVDGTTGILIPPKDADAIASACIRLLRDPELRNRMGIAGRKRVEKYFTAERMTREIEHVLMDLVCQKG